MASRAAIRAAARALEPQQIIPAIQQLIASVACGADVDSSSTTTSLAHAQQHQQQQHQAQQAGTHAIGVQSLASVRHDIRPLHAQPTHRSIQHDSIWDADMVRPRADSISSSSGGSSRGKDQAAGSAHTSTSGSSTAAGSGGQVQVDPLTAALMALQHNPKAHKLTPSAIVQKLDTHIVGQAVSAAASLQLLWSGSSCSVTDFVQRRGVA